MLLLEREPFLTDLGAALASAAAGKGRIGIVTGEAGIGKTALVQSFCDRHWKSARILWGDCDALFTPRPLGPLHDIAHQSGGNLLALLETGAARTWIFAAFLDNLQAGTRPTIVVFEDIHWADEATLDLVKFAGRRIHRTRALLILTYRDDEVALNHPMRLVLGELPAASLTRLSLPPLTEEAVAVMARQARRQAEGVYAVTEGNPLFVTEVLAGSSDRVPATIRDAVLTRAARLSQGAREVLELTSVTPSRTERWLLSAAAASTPAVLDECAIAGMLQVDDATVSFRHELARRTIEDSLPPIRCQRLHALVLQTLVDRGHAAAQATRILHHASRALDGDAVVRYAPIAAQQASAMGAHREAAVHYATALAHADRFPPEERARLLEGQSYSAYLTFQLAAAFDARAAALQIWRQLGCREKEGDSLRWLSRIAWYDGRRTDADRYAAMALEVLETLPPGRELAMAYSNRAQLHMLAEETAEAMHWGTKASDLARALGDHEILAHALANTGTTEYRFNPRSGRPKLEQSLRISIEHGFEDHAGRAYNNLVTHSIDSRDYSGAERYMNEGLAYCIEHDLDAYTLAIRSRRAHLNLERGCWDAAAEEAEAVLKAGPGPQVRITALWVLARVRLRRGDAGVCKLLDEAASLAHGTGELQRIGPVSATRAEAAWLTGDARRTAAEARPAFELAMTRRNPWELGELSFWMWRGGELSEPPAGAAQPFVLQISGDWREAAAEWERIGCPYAQAWALADGDEVAQRVALGILDRLGAPADSIRRKMRAQGVRSIPRGARPATRRNAAGLTPREVEVLTLVSKGLPVRQVAERLFLSAKTVDNHLSAILSKLNVHSRAAAVAAACDLGIISRSTES